MKFYVRLPISLAAMALPLLFAAPTLQAQIDTGPYPRFMGGNYSNGLSTVAGPGSGPAFGVNTTTQGQIVPVVASNGKVVLSAGYVACFSSTGTLIWSTSSSFNSSYGTPTYYPPAIGKEGSDYVVYVTTTSGPGGPSGLVALELNASGPGATVKWAYTSSLPDVPEFSPVVGSDGMVYAVGARMVQGGGDQRLYAFKSGNLIWTWGGYNTTGDQVTMASNLEPILFTNGSNTYIILSGIINIGPVNNFYTNTIRCLVVKDAGTQGPLVSDVWFPHYFQMNAQDPSGEYYPNGSPSLSPDGKSLIVPWLWSGSSLSGTDAGIACMSLSGTSLSTNWPLLLFSQAANVAPPASSVDATVPNNANPYHFTAAIDATGAYCTNALGTAMYERALYGFILNNHQYNAGDQVWKTSLGTSVGGFAPALDDTNSIWIAANVGSTSGSVIHLDPTYGTEVSVTTSSALTINGAAVAIGDNLDLFMTTTLTNGTHALGLQRVH